MKKIVVFLLVGLVAAYLNFCGYEGIYIYAGMVAGAVGIVMLLGKLGWERVALFLLIGTFAAFLNYHGHKGLLLEVAALVGLIGVIMLFDKLTPFFGWIESKFQPGAKRKKEEKNKKREKVEPSAGI